MSGQVLLGLFAGLMYAWGGLFLLIGADKLSGDAISRLCGDNDLKGIAFVAFWPVALVVALVLHVAACKQRGVRPLSWPAVLDDRRR